MPCGLVSKERCHKQCVEPGCDGVPIEESRKRMCIISRLQPGSLSCACVRTCKRKASLHVLNVYPPRLLVSRR